jgi:hypothetical protein
MTNETEERAMSKRDEAALLERDEAIWTQRMSGDSLAAIGHRFGLSAEGVRLIVDRYGTKQVDDLELRLMANRGSDDLEVFVIPDHQGENFNAAITHFQWCVTQLAKRGITTRIHYRPVHNGVCIGLEDVTDYGGSEQ